MKINNRYNNLVFSHHLFLTSGSISDNARYISAHEINDSMINLLAIRYSVSGNSVNAHTTHHRAAIITYFSLL